MKKILTLTIILFAAFTTNAHSTSTNPGITYDTGIYKC